MFTNWNVGNRPLLAIVACCFNVALIQNKEEYSTLPSTAPMSFTFGYAASKAESDVTPLPNYPGTNE
jgi:hypothetical protein